MLATKEDCLAFAEYSHQINQSVRREVDAICAVIPSRQLSPAQERAIDRCDAAMEPWRKRQALAEAQRHEVERLPIGDAPQSYYDEARALNRGVVRHVNRVMRAEQGRQDWRDWTIWRVLWAYRWQALGFAAAFALGEAIARWQQIWAATRGTTQ